MPLKGNYDEEKYKLYYFDTGMLVAMLDEEAQEDLRANKNMNVYKGALYENVVAEALVKSGYGLYYYKKRKCYAGGRLFCKDERFSCAGGGKGKPMDGQSLYGLLIKR